MAPKRYDHWTEYAEEVTRFLRDALQGEPEHCDSGPDFLVGGMSVELKACREWNITRFANGKRRRGRFFFRSFAGDADMFLFALIRAGGQLDFRLMSGRYVERLIGGWRDNVSINYRRIFQ
jgi:hypothetical protein